MKKTLVIFILSLLPLVAIVAKENPPVKKTKNGICHPKDGTYYKRIKNYVSYSSMEACLKSGGRKPKR